MQFYRVAREVERGVYESLSPPHPSWKVRHGLGEVVRGVAGPLLGFRSLREAERFALRYHWEERLVVLEAQGDCVHAPPYPWRPDAAIIGDVQDPLFVARRYWAALMNPEECPWELRWAPGTVAANSFVATGVVLRPNIRAAQSA